MVASFVHALPALAAARKSRSTDGDRATVSHMNVRELRNQTAAVVAAVQAGETVTLTSNGEPGPAAG